MPQVSWLRQTVTEYESFIVTAKRVRWDLDRERRNEQEQADRETWRRDQERELRMAEEEARQQEVAEEEARQQEVVEEEARQ